MTDVALDPRVLRRYDVGMQVGRGAYGVVWRAVRRKDGATVALKKCFEAFRCDVDARRTYREVRYLQALAGHANVVRLMDVLRAGNDRDLYLGAWRPPPPPPARPRAVRRAFSFPRGGAPHVTPRRPAVVARASLRVRGDGSQPGDQGEDSGTGPVSGVVRGRSLHTAP